MNGVREIPVEQLRVSKLNPRRTPGDVSEIAESIRQIGVIEPLVVVPAPAGDKGFVVLCGSRRLAGALSAGLTKVPAVVREDLSELEREVLMLSENVHRAKLSHLEIATVYARLLKLFGLSAKEIGHRCGTSDWHVSVHLAFLKQPKRLISQVEAGELSFSEAMGLGSHRNYAKNPKGKPRGLPVSLHQIKGHTKCKPERCEVRAFADQLGVSA